MRILQYKRKEKRKTNYRKRLKLISNRDNKAMGQGQAGPRSGLYMRPRLVIRKTLKHMLVQFASYAPEGDRIMACAHTRELSAYGWKGAVCNTPAAYLVGLLAGLKAKQKGITCAILDIGLYPSVSGSILYAALKGAIDSGVDIPHKQDVFPSEERITGVHINPNNKLEFENTKKAILKTYQISCEMALNKGEQKQNGQRK